MRGREWMVGRDREIWGQQNIGRDVERETESRSWRHTERQRHEGWLQRKHQAWEERRGETDR